MNKFKIGDKVIVYGKVKAIVEENSSPPYYIVRYEKQVPGSPLTGAFRESALELVELWESPLYQIMRENDEQ